MFYNISKTFVIIKIIPIFAFYQYNTDIKAFITIAMTDE